MEKKQPEQEAVQKADEKVDEDVKSDMIDLLNEVMELAGKCGRWFVTVTRKEGELLHHWQGGKNFVSGDKFQSLKEIETMLEADLPNRHERRKIKKMKRSYH